MPTDKEKLLPCPFCGGEAQVEDYEYRRQFLNPTEGDCRITCDGCMARSDVMRNEDGDGDRVKAAIKVWNARYPTKREEKLRKALEHCNNVLKEHIRKPEPIGKLMGFMKGAQQTAEQALQQTED